jgi:hypothetical protein
MSLRTRLGRLLYNGEKDWDKAISIAIGPNWLRGIKFKVDAVGRPLEIPAMKIFSAYLEVVCKSRESGISMPAKGTRSLQATAFECVMNAIPRIEELGGLPGGIIERLWKEMNRRFARSITFFCRTRLLTGAWQIRHITSCLEDPLEGIAPYRAC